MTIKKSDLSIPKHKHRYLSPSETQKQYRAWLESEKAQGRDHRPKDKK